MSEAAVTIDALPESVTLRFGGAVVISAITALDRALSELPKAPRVVIDLGGVDALDTAGAWLITSLMARLTEEGVPVELTGVDPAQRSLLDNVARSIPTGETPAEPARGFLPFLERLGHRTVEGFQGLVAIVGFFGLVLASLGRVILHPSRMRITSLVHQMEEVGFSAVPIVALMSFLIGVTLGFQGASQLRQFGADVFVVNLIAISVLRELGILLTAIIVAGRSGSAFTAAIGSMKLREEIDAMRTLGLDPVEVLILPRVMALLIMLPVLGFIADVAGLVGGMMMSWATLGVSPQMFLTRLVDTTGVWHIAIGFIKAPFFALIIGVIGCYQGMQVKGSAESLGRLTTKSVVLSIFTVIVVDAIFSVFFSELDL